MGSCYDSHLFHVLGSLIIFPPAPLPVTLPSAATPSSWFKSVLGHFTCTTRNKVYHAEAMEVFYLTPSPTPSTVHFAPPPSHSPSHYTLLLHEAQAIDPSDNPVFHIGRLILTQSPAADARPILQVLEHAEYERWSLIYILLVPLTPEEQHEKHCWQRGSDCGLPAFRLRWTQHRRTNLKITHNSWHTCMACTHAAGHTYILNPPGRYSCQKKHATND